MMSTKCGAAGVRHKVAVERGCGLVDGTGARGSRSVQAAQRCTLERGRFVAPELTVLLVTRTGGAAIRAMRSTTVTVAPQRLRALEREIMHLFSAPLLHHHPWPGPHLSNIARAYRLISSYARPANWT